MQEAMAVMVCEPTSEKEFSGGEAVTVEDAVVTNVKEDEKETFPSLSKLLDNRTVLLWLPPKGTVNDIVALEIRGLQKSYV